MNRLLLIVCLCLVCLPTVPAAAQSKSKNNLDELTLERLFPEESIFGPSARNPEFSADGRYAAYLYRPYDERRHGNDLWIYDFQDQGRIRG